jgi:hypothetical protein
MGEDIEKADGIHFCKRNKLWDLSENFVNCISVVGLRISSTASLSL